MNMQVYQNRLDSFLQPRRAKGSLKSHKPIKWPHPTYFTATPEVLAEAGFYFDPSPDDTDNVTCFMCGKELGDWAENDDPFNLHFKKCGKKCAWANVRCGLDMDKNEQFIFTDKNRLPTSKLMEKARLETFTFGSGWCHDQGKGHGASSKKMAKAGFIYSPAEDGDDLAACLYCGISLSGWDADDDPTEEHRKRVKKSGIPCPMFPDIIFSKSTKSKSKSAHVDSFMPTKTFDGEDDVSDATAQTVASTSTTKTPRSSRSASRGAKTPKAPASRSSSKARQTSVLETDGEEETESRPTSRASKKGATHTRSRSVSRAATVEPDSAVEDEPAPARRKASSSRSKVKNVGEHTDDDSATTVPKKHTRSKSKSRVSVIPENTAAEDEEVEESVASAAPKPRSKSVSRKPSSRALTRTASAKLTEDEDDIPSVQVKKPPSKSTKSGKSKSIPSAVDLFDDDEVMDVDEPEPPAPASSAPKRKSSKALLASKTFQQEELGINGGGNKKKGAHSRTASTSQRGKSRATAAQVEEVEEVAEGDDELEIISNIPPSSVDPEPIPEPAPSTSTAKKPSKSKSNPKLKNRSPPAEEPAPLPEHQGTDVSMHEVPQVEKPAPAPVSTLSKARKPLSRAPSTSAVRSDGPVSALHPLESKAEIQDNNLPASLDSGELHDMDEDKTIPPATPGTSFVVNSMKDLGKGKPSTKPKAAALLRQTSYVGSQRAKSRSGSASDIEVDAALQIVDISSEEEEGHRHRKNAASTTSKSKAKTKTKAKVTEIGAEVVGKSSDAPPASSSSSSSTKPTSGNRVRSGSVKQGSVKAQIARLESIEIIDSGNGSGGKTAPPSPVKSVPKEDVEMADVDVRVEAEAVELEPPRPSTPPRSTTPPPPPSPIVVPKTPLPLAKSENTLNIPMTPGFKFVPPLSKEPFVNLDVLTDAELSMTVEEWIRHQMDIEYNKFKQDGEKELAAFQERVEEVRKAIEAL